MGEKVSGGRLSLGDLKQAGAKLPASATSKINRDQVDTLACQIVGVLAGAGSNEVRRRALEKARRMLGVR